MHAMHRLRVIAFLWQDWLNWNHAEEPTLHFWSLHVSYCNGSRTCVHPKRVVFFWPCSHHYYLVCLLGILHSNLSSTVGLVFSYLLTIFLSLSLSLLFPAEAALITMPFVSTPKNYSFNISFCLEFVLCFLPVSLCPESFSSAALPIPLGICSRPESAWI